MHTDGSEEAVGSGLEERKGAEAVDEVKRQSMDGAGGERRRSNGAGGIGVAVEGAHHGEGIRHSNAAMPAHWPARPVAAHCDGRGVAAAAPILFYCSLRSTRARQANGGVYAGRGSPSRLEGRNAVEAGEVRFSGTAGLSSSRACVVSVITYVRQTCLTASCESWGS